VWSPPLCKPKFVNYYARLPCADVRARATSQQSIKDAQKSAKKEKEKKAGKTPKPSKLARLSTALPPVSTYARHYSVADRSHVIACAVVQHRHEPTHWVGMRRLALRAMLCVVFYRCERACNSVPHAAVERAQGVSRRHAAARSWHVRNTRNDMLD
jgi:hypothetical protein